MVKANPICIIVTVTKTATSFLLESAPLLFVLSRRTADLRLVKRTIMAVPIVKTDWNKQQKSFFEHKPDDYADRGL